jgi:hypothetical protein
MTALDMELIMNQHEQSRDAWERHEARLEAVVNDLPDDMPIEHICLLTDLLDDATARVSAWRDKLNNGEIV